MTSSKPHGWVDGRPKSKRYTYGVMLDPQAGNPVIFFTHKTKLPPGVLQYERLNSASAAAVRRMAHGMLSSKSREDWVDVEPLTTPLVSPKNKTSVKIYAYGLAPRNGRYKAFVHTKGKTLPDGAINLSEFSGTGQEAWLLAERQRGINSRVEPPTPVEPVPPPRVELVPGAVAFHVDPEGQHLGILLQEVSLGMWQVLFFTSNPKWGKRRASQGELALAGHITTKVTFLAMVVRSDVGLIPTQHSFPPHRVEALIAEFNA